ncbi:SDR family oxidoreductase [Neiella sp. HB171785]|uniref:SDR family oxidoreductase n=1 Tax=Neiella litorisoli TaxID=2771431 RepID=A0A8J6QGM1_9GAMM|nr:SDR family oxidoreductase [Neiella litorisoli]MBD1389045.1 SDR family oxidoreductase [Neiella litorisoli]
MLNNGETIYPSLKDKVVFLSGGGTGIGSTIVERLCQNGAKVAFVDVAVAQSKALCAELKDNTPLFIECDVRDIEALQQAISRVAETFGTIDVVINSAADDSRHCADDISVEYWDESQALNLRHYFFATQAAIPYMKQKGAGCIINMGSGSWRAKQAGMPAYTTAKAGIEGLTRSLAAKYGRDNIRVNTLIPGWVMTIKQRSTWATEEVIADLLDAQCLKDQIKPNDIANAALFLASDDSRMITAQTLVVDAGWT